MPGASNKSSLVNRGWSKAISWIFETIFCGDVIFGYRSCGSLPVIVYPFLKSIMVVDLSIMCNDEVLVLTRIALNKVFWNPKLYLIYCWLCLMICLYFKSLLVNRGLFKAISQIFGTISRGDAVFGYLPCRSSPVIECLSTISSLIRFEESSL